MKKTKLKSLYAEWLKAKEEKGMLSEIGWIAFVIHKENDAMGTRIGPLMITLTYVVCGVCMFFFSFIWLMFLPAAGLIAVV